MKKGFRGLLFCFLLVLCCHLAYGAPGGLLITTAAGNGHLGYSGDGGDAAAASFAYPIGITLDKDGNLYIADTENNRIRRVDAQTRTISTIAGNGASGYSTDGIPAIASSLSNPSYIAMDPVGNLYISDQGNNRIRRVSAAAKFISTVAGNGNRGYSGDGNLAVRAQLSGPTGIVVDSGGNILFSDCGNHRIRRVDAATGNISTVAGDGYKDGFGNGRFAGDGGAASAASLNFPTGLALDSAGNLYVCDEMNNRIRKIDVATGKISTIAGGGTPADGLGDGGPATSAKLNRPGGIAIAPSGEIVLADYGNHRVRRISGGTISTIAGTGTRYGLLGDGGWATLARVAGPGGVACDSEGNIYVVSILDSNVRRLSAGAVFTSPADLIKPGWNLVSIPAEPLNADPLVMFSGFDVPNSSLQFWKNNVDGGGFQSYGTSMGWLGPIQRGIPYWMLYQGTPQGISYMGLMPGSSFELSIAAHQSAPFWIMIGTPYASPVPCSSITFTNLAVSGDPKGWTEAYSLRMVESVALGFDAATGQFVTAGPAEFLPQQTSLQPWAGYWLLVNRAEGLTITFPKP